MDLSKTMTISVTTSYVTTPLAGDCPADLPAGTSWPPPDGTIIMYTFGDTGIAVCSDCVTDPAKVRSVRRYYDVSITASIALRPSPRRDNRYYDCTVREPRCGQRGSRLT